MPALQRSSIPNATTDPVNRTQVWPVGLFVAGTLVYLYLFYRSHLLRQLGLGKVLVPDDLVHEWVGNDWSRFGILDHVPILVAAGIILGAAFLIGRLVLDLLQVEMAFDRLEKLNFSIAIGLNVLSLFTLAIGLAGGLHQRWLFAVMLLIVLTATAMRRKKWQESATKSSAAINSPDSKSMSSSDRSSKQDSSNPVHEWRRESLRFVAWLCVPFAALIVLGGMLPPTQFDVREYHAQVPKEWFVEGKVSFLPHNVYGNMPLGAEMHGILGMMMVPGNDSWWWGTLIGKAVIAILAPLTGLAIYTAGRRFFSATAGVIGAFVYVSIPWIAHVSMTGLIDGASSYYMFLAVYAAMIRWDIRTKQKSDSQAKSSQSATDWGLVSVCGFLAGSGAACKYPALVFLVLPLGVYLSLLQFRAIQWKSAIVFTLAVVAAFGLWLGKNWAFTGNPTYPLLYRWFDGATWTPEKDARWNKAHSPPRDAQGHAFTAAKLWDSIRLITNKSDLLSPAVLPLAILACFSRGIRKWLLLLLGFVIWTTATWWLLTHRLDRFLIPLLPLAALLAGAGAAWRYEILWQRVVVGFLLWCFVANLVIDATVLVAENRYFVALRDLRQDVPRMSDHSDTRIHDAHRYLNEHVPPGYRALLVGEAQVFDLEVPILYNTCFDDCVFEQLMKGKSRDERLQVLRDLRVSHLYFSWSELRRYRSPGNYGYSDYPTRELVHQEFVDQQKLLRRVPLELNPEQSEVFEVVGWQDWPPLHSDVP